MHAGLPISKDGSIGGTGGTCPQTHCNVFKGEGEILCSSIQHTEYCSCFASYRHSLPVWIIFTFLLLPSNFLTCGLWNMLRSSLYFSGQLGHTRFIIRHPLKVHLCDQCKPNCPWLWAYLLISSCTWLTWVGPLAATFSWWWVGAEPKQLAS